EFRYGVNYAQQKNRDYQNKFYGGGQSTGGAITINDFTGLTENVLQLIRYENSWGDHNFDALIAHENNAFTRTFASVSKGLQISPFLYDLDNFQSALGLASGSTDVNTIESYFSQFNYNYAQKYYLTASVRTDGSSRFVNDKWGTFGSVGAGWVMSAEDFLSDVDFVDFLKVKVSYGILGDQLGVGRFSGYNRYNGGNLDGNLSLAPGLNGNPDLTWETSKMFQTGIEFTLGANQFLEGSLDYFQKNTDNLIFNRFVGPSLGISSITVNDGELKNSGLEFDLTTHILNKEDYSFDFNVNGSFLDNEIIATPTDPATGEPQLLTPGGNYGRVVGGSIFDFYMREWAGVDPADGAPTWFQYYDDRNDNGVLDAGEPTSDSNASWVPVDPNISNDTGSIVEYQTKISDANIKKVVTRTYSDASNVFVGKSSIPTVSGAFRLSGRVHDFSISAQFTYSLGGYGYDAQYAELMSDRFGAAGNNFHKDIANRWRNPGDITDVPALTDNAITNSTSTSSRFITSTDFLALNNLNIGYKLPAKYLKSTIKSVNVYVSGDNLFQRTARRGYYPTTSETGASGRGLFAPVTTVTMGVRVKL
ncbi:TonB-dependent receptor domain-containing protein, partial [Polaribacter sp.]|uniref:TonB-dependent receptor domain-containing protein n=1 Tax=Polaribacter sp. TaxID=1920175 RepID=UPI003F6B7F1C